ELRYGRHHAHRAIRLRHPGVDRLRYRQDPSERRDDGSEEPERSAGLHDRAGRQSALSESCGNLTNRSGSNYVCAKITQIFESRTSRAVRTYFERSSQTPSLGSLAFAWRQTRLLASRSEALR